MTGGPSGGFGTRIYFIPNPGMDVKGAQILHGSGYVTINIKGAHYRSSGNLWQRIFGGSDKVTLSTQITHASPNNSVSNASVEEIRKIDVGRPYYFGSNRAVALNLPTDCDAIEMSVKISAVQDDNLSGALELLNSGELKSTLQLAPPAVSEALAIGSVVKKLLSDTDPQSSLQAEYDGRLSTTGSDDPIRDFCLAQGTIILIYRESDDDISLDALDPAKLSTDGDGLKYNGQPMPNTYVMFQVSFAALRGEDPAASWYGIFSSASQDLDGLIAAADDSEKEKAWSAAFALYQQGAKLLLSDATYTQYEAKGIAATHLSDLQKKYASLAGQAKPAAVKPMLLLGKFNFQGTDDMEKIAQEYQARLTRSNVSLPGPLKR